MEYILFSSIIYIVNLILLMLTTKIFMLILILNHHTLLINKMNLYMHLSILSLLIAYTLLKKTSIYFF